MDARATVAAIMLSGFGFFLIWQGITGNVVKLGSGKAFIPRWFYVLGGCSVLVLPVAYLVVQTMTLLNAE